MKTVDTVLREIRGLFIGLTLLSMLMPVSGEGIAAFFCVASGICCGFRIERELSSLRENVGCVSLIADA